MSAYTPTTDEVRDAFAGHDFDQALAGAQFDRWLAEVERAAAARGWDEGRAHGFNEGRDYFGFGGGCGPDVWDCDCPNPYRRNEGEEK